MRRDTLGQAAPRFGIGEGRIHRGTCDVQQLARRQRLEEDRGARVEGLTLRERTDDDRVEPGIGHEARVLERDRGLQGVRAQPVANRFRALQCCKPSVHEHPVPAGAVLVGEEDDLPVTEACLAARVEEAGIHPLRLGGELWGYGSKLAGLCFSGANLIPLRGGPAAMRAFADRALRRQWSDKGALDSQARAMNRVKTILSKDHPSLYSPELDAQIRATFEGLVPGELIPFGAPEPIGAPAVSRN